MGGRKRRLVIPTLTLLVICSQIGPMTAMAATNDEILGLLNDTGTEVSIVIEDEGVAAPVKTSKTSVEEMRRSQSSSYSNSSKTGTQTNSTQSGYSADGRTYYSPYTGKSFDTTKRLADAHPDLKYDLEDYFGLRALCPEDLVDSSLWGAIVTPNSAVLKALNSSKERIKLGDIAVKNGLVNKNNTKASHLIGLFTYYGIVNTDDGKLDYSNSTKAYLSREQAALMLGRFMHSRAYILDDRAVDIKDSYTYEIMGKGESTYYVWHYSNHALIGEGDYGFTKSTLSASMTRLEFIYMLMRSYFPSDVRQAEIDKLSCADIFTDIDKDDYVDEAYNKKNKLLDSEGFVANENQANRQWLKDKKLGYNGEVAAAYRLGILTPNEKGGADLFKPITMSQAARMLVAAAKAQAEGKSVN